MDVSAAHNSVRIRRPGAGHKRRIIKLWILVNIFYWSGIITLILLGADSWN